MSEINQETYFWSDTYEAHTGLGAESGEPVAFALNLQVCSFEVVITNVRGGMESQLPIFLFHLLCREPVASAFGWDQLRFVFLHAVNTLYCVGEPVASEYKQKH